MLSRTASISAAVVRSLSSTSACSLESSTISSFIPRALCLIALPAFSYLAFIFWPLARRCRDLLSLRSSAVCMRPMPRATSSSSRRFCWRARRIGSSRARSSHGTRHQECRRQDRRWRGGVEGVRGPAGSGEQPGVRSGVGGGVRRLFPRWRPVQSSVAGRRGHGLHPHRQAENSRLRGGRGQPLLVMKRVLMSISLTLVWGQWRTNRVNLYLRLTGQSRMVQPSRKVDADQLQGGLEWSIVSN